jgi:methylthioribose-1-phosphate isomerase
VSLLLTFFVGVQIPIEERSQEEVLGVSGHFGTVQWAPSGAKVYNPAFDVTPVELIESIILDTGVYSKAQIQGQAFAELKKPYHV